MGLSLKGLNGSLKGKVFPLRAGMTLGRKGDLEIKDPKASSLHAKIDQLSDGSLAITDNNSKNGLFINDEDMPSAALIPGVKITIGEHSFEVIGKREESGKSKVVAPEPAPDLMPPPAPVAPFTNESLKAMQEGAVKPSLAKPRVGGSLKTEHMPIIPVAPEPPAAPASKYWYEVLSTFIEKNQDHVVNARKTLIPLSPALVLEFHRGPQMHTKWTLGYGPRKVGARCMDLPIFEPGAPDICFEIIPTPQGIVFKTTHPEKVQLNGKKVDNKMLHVGDSIRINETVIEVDFIE